MSDNPWTNDDSDQSEGAPKALRDHAKQLDKQLKDAQAALEKANDQIASLTKANHQTTLDGLLKDVPPSAAKWLKRDFTAENIDPSAEAVQKWLAENGGDFGYKPEGDKPAGEAPKTPEDQDLSPETLAAYQAIQEISGTNAEGGNATIQQIQALDQNPNASYEDLVKAFRAMGAPLASNA